MTADPFGLDDRCPTCGRPLDGSHAPAACRRLRRQRSIRRRLLLVRVAAWFDRFRR